MEEKKLISLRDIPQDIMGAFKDNLEKSKRIMAYYDCALLEVETKFKVLGAQSY